MSKRSFQVLSRSDQSKSKRSKDDNKTNWLRDSTFNAIEKKQFASYLKNKVVSKDEGALIILWCESSLVQFAAIASGDRVKPRPPYLPQQGVISGHEIKAGIITEVQPYAGNTYLNALIGPNTSTQYGQIVAMLTVIFTNSFMQECMQLMKPHLLLGEIFKILNNKMTRVEPFEFIPLPPGMKQIFEYKVKYGLER